MNEQEQRALSQRLSRIEGQARGIKKMIEEGQEEAAILVQLMAMQKATRAATTTLVKVRAIACIRDQVRTAIDQALADLDLDALLQTHLKVGE